MPTLLDFSAGVATGAGGNTFSGGQMVDAVTSGVPMLTAAFPGPTLVLQFPKYGDSAYRVLPDQACTLSLAGGAPRQLQLMRVLIQQPYGGNCEITWPDSMIWPDGAAFVDSRIGSVCCVEIMWDGKSQYYGRRIFG